LSPSEDPKDTIYVYFLLTVCSEGPCDRTTGGQQTTATCWRSGMCHHKLHMFFLWLAHQTVTEHNKLTELSFSRFCEPSTDDTFIMCVSFFPSHGINNGLYRLFQKMQGEHIVQGLKRSSVLGFESW